MVAVEPGLLVHPFRGLRGQRERGTGGDGDLPGVDQVDHAVLDHLGVGGEVLERTLQQTREHRVRDVAHTRLQRQQVLGQPAVLDLVGQEVQEVARDRPGIVVEGLERGVAVRGVGLDDRHHLVGVHLEHLVADPVARAGDGKRTTVRGQDTDGVVDVVHAEQVLGLPRVDLDDDLVGLFEIGAVQADRGGGHDVAVLGDRGGLDDGEVQRAQEALRHLQPHVREMDVAVVGDALVDRGAHLGIGLVGRTERDAPRAGQRPVELRCGRGPGPHTDAEFLTLLVRGFDARGEGLGELLGVTGPGEARETDVPAVLDQSCRVLSGHQLGAETLVVNPT